MSLAIPESYGNADAVETVEIQRQDSHRSHSVLEISRKQRDSHIPTAPTVSVLRFNQTTPAEELGALEKWKSKSRIPTFPPHRWPAA